MNRRQSLRNLVIASGGLLVLPAWTTDWTAASLADSPGFLSAGESDMLAEIVDAIIPEGNGIGGLSVGTEKFLRKLFADCYEPDVQLNIKTQLTNLQSSAQKNYNTTFGQCDLAQRQALFASMLQSENKAEKDFAVLVKSETIRGFSTSKEVMTRLHYKVAPGHYHGCIDMKP